MRRFSRLPIALSVFLLTSSLALAQKEEETKFGIGFQSAFPAWGISGMMDVSDEFSVQGILGAFGDLKTYAGRGIYRFEKKPNYNTYGYGMVGAWSYTGFEIGSGFQLKETTETVMGFGAGVGIEYDWRVFAPELPPIMWNLEIGLGSVKFGNVDFSFSTLMVGAGAHYRL